MASTAQRLASLHQLSGELMDLSRAARLMEWDQETMMPLGGRLLRARSLATLEGVLHERLTQPQVGNLLDSLEASAASETLNQIDQALLREMRREYDRAVKLPNEFVREMARSTSEALEIWRRAREEDRFRDFAPALEHIIALKREEADLVGFQAHPYDALLDRYEPGLTVHQLTPLFSSLRQATINLVDRLRGAPRQPNPKLLVGQFDLDKQWQFGLWLLETIGFDGSSGRLDRSTHPFAESLGPGDVRLTTRQRLDTASDLIFGNLHEGGHGLYEQGIDPELALNSVGQAVSLGIHESQSRLWENLVGRGAAFWQYAYPRLQTSFPEHFGPIALDEFLLAINHVTPSPIRVDADEVTYNLHIIMRFELERQLTEGTLRPRDLADAWRQLTHDYLGLTLVDDRQGVLQDIHWAMGLFAYFPTYTLGNLYAAQLWSALHRALPTLDEQLAQGQTGPLLAWLREHIHRPGRLYRPAELIERATGAPPRPEFLVTYLTTKYARLYGLSEDQAPAQ